MKKSLGIKNLKSFYVSAFTGEGIIDFINSIELLEDNEDNIEPENYYLTNKIKVNTLLFNNKYIITKGFKLVCHFIDSNIKDIINCEIIYVQNNLIKETNKKAEMIFLLEKPISIKKGTKILLRTNNNETIGTAQIISLVPIK
jgi:hypothetical protein